MCAKSILLLVTATSNETQTFGAYALLPRGREYELNALGLRPVFFKSPTTTGIVDRLEILVTIGSLVYYYYTLSDRFELYSCARRR
jgi:hypothetical protein